MSANLLACEVPASHVAGKYFNVATGVRVTLNYTYSVLQKLTKFELPPLYAPERAGDIKHSLADISLAEEQMGYRPVVEFEEGLRRTVAWYRTQVPTAVKA